MEHLVALGRWCSLDLLDDYPRSCFKKPASFDQALPVIAQRDLDSVVVAVSNQLHSAPLEALCQYWCIDISTLDELAVYPHQLLARSDVAPSASDLRSQSGMSQDELYFQILTLNSECDVLMVSYVNFTAYCSTLHPHLIPF
jgi:hypothetical protein